ncbi:ketoacyl-ACP synthase III [Bacillus haynesii]|uniref:Beta-ketoacyl-[acyl-carrier-protein] synthase III n=1 Tax=Bacillus haynesii TaxID=1925021 RepID=A0AA90ESR0_9BACI|nr:ketoacyl-ACP synthase III [Bacillus haynesii]MCY7790081.1 ketoacyl-ACP synthase III [Bacillus haynesii]MCY8001814.1 ketoacyl-ACP synthase III [Bacillus haynesii]MCY8100983.1 ketoacyl-ACP synthase III [Bacillus haynesii]MCY8468993.1 ketoacyl-ACP synthase III [Bacillus haynesii]MCY8559721.1 ketoacyl-ACP synthase III [Bacillus haynesii]
MKTLSKARISAIGTYVPEKRMTNKDFEKIVDTSDEWIIQRTGMKERRIAGSHEFTSDLCIKAVEDLKNRYRGTLDDIDMIIVSTTTADYAFPSTACQVQEHFGWNEVGAVDVNATCAGLAYGLHIANGLITSGLHRKILVISGETLSKTTDYTDRTSCILFGDGAGALLVERDDKAPSFITFAQDTRGDGARHLYRTGLRSDLKGEPLSGEGKMVQNGREVYKWAVRSVPEGVKKLLTQAEMELKDIDWFVPHSANLRMIESICEKTGIPAEKALTSVEWFGNTSSASIVLALDEAVKNGKLKEGNTLILFGFGGGLTYTGLIVKWGAPAS